MPDPKGSIFIRTRLGHFLSAKWLRHPNSSKKGNFYPHDGLGMGEIVKFFFAAQRRATQHAKHARNHVLANVAGYSCQNYNVFMIYHHQGLHRVLQHLLFSDAGAF